MRAAILLATLLLARAVPALGEGAAKAPLTLVGPDRLELQVQSEDLQSLPPHRVHVAFLGPHGEEAADYDGVSLWDLLTDSSLIPPGPLKNHASLVVYVTGRDGWRAAVAAAEIDPEFEGKAVLLGHAAAADPADAGALRLVVPGDRHGARAVRDVVRIEVR